MRGKGGLVELKPEQKRFEIALQASGDYIFEYDVKEDMLTDFSNYCESGGNPHIWRNFFTNLIKKSCCKIEELEELEDFLYGRRRTAKLSVFRFKKDMPDYRCYSFGGQPIYEKDNLIKVIGRISDITYLEKNEEKLSVSAYMDGLTSAYTPSRGLYLLEEFFREWESTDYALIFADIVNMNTINNTYSMPFGNAVIKFTADKIKELMDRDDIVIRIGGCQFLVLCKHTDQEKTKKLALKMMAIPQTIYTGDEITAKEKIRIAVIEGYPWRNCPSLPKVVEKMNTELKSSDETKICYIEPEKLRHLDDAASAFCESNNYQGLSFSFCNTRQDLIAYSFELLEKTENLHSAVHMLLFTIGNILKMSSIRIYEVDDGYLTKRLLYHWNDKGKEQDTPQIVKYPDKKTMNGILDLFGENGVIEWTDLCIPECPMEIMEYIRREYTCKKLYAKQMLLDKKAAGIIVFMSDKAGEWTEEEKKFFESLTQLLAIHIDKARSDRANRAKTVFLSRMSHEIRTPLNGIVGMTEILKKFVEEKNRGLKRTQIDDKIEDCLKKIDASTVFLTSILNDILEMANIESGQLKLLQEAFTMEEIADDLESMVLTQMHLKGLDFELQREYDRIYVLGDSLRIMQVLMNLAGNSLKFTPAGGKVTVRIEQKCRSEEGVAYKISVKDTGCGISEADKEIIFRSFMQAKTDKERNRGGAGLGLTISQNIVTMLGGRLELVSTLGQGTEFFFSFCLPYAEGEEKKENRMTAAQLEGKAYKGKRILLAEDNSLNAEIAETILGMWGFEVDKAADGAIAVEKFKSSEAGYYDVIIMDIRMPNMDGLAATKEIRTSGHKNARKIPIIAMTSDAFDEDIEKAVSCGMNGYLAKPVRPDQIREILERVIL